MLSKVRKIFGKGGIYRLRYTLTPVIFSTYALLNRYAALRDENEWEAKIKKIFHFVMNTISALKTETEMYEMCLKLLLQVVSHFYVFLIIFLLNRVRWWPIDWILKKEPQLHTNFYQM